MLVSRFSLNRKAIVTEIFGDKGPTYFWQQLFLSRWLPLLLGLGMGIFLAWLIVSEAWTFLVPVVLFVPAVMVFNRYPFVAVMIWILVMPYFAITPTANGRYIYWILHRAMIPVALGVVILSDWLRVRKKEPVRFGPAELAMVIFLGLTLANIFLFSNEPHLEMVYHFYDHLFIPFCMYWLVRLIAPGEEDLKRFSWAAFITVVAQSIIGLLSWFAPQVLPPHWLGLQGLRTVGSLGNAAVYTTTLIFLSLVLFQYAMHCRSGWLRTVLLLAFSLALFCVFFSFSRGSWLGGSVVLVGLMFMYPKVIIRQMIIVLVLIFILSSSILADEVAWAWERFNDDKTTDARVIQTSAAIKMTQAKPFFGWGYGNYDRYDRKFITRVGSVAAQDDTSHHTFLTLTSELGMIPFLFYIFPLGWWLRLTIKTWRRLPRDSFWSLSLLVMLWLMMLDHIIVRSFMDMIRYFPFGTTVWWLTIALIANMIYPYLGSNDSGRQEYSG